jgi:hypothetical protein
MARNSRLTKKVAEAPVARDVSSPNKWPRAGTRQGKRAMTVWVTEDVFKDIKILAIKQDKTIQDLLLEQVNATLVKYGVRRA